MYPYAENLTRQTQDIVRKRTLAGITQTEIADAVGVSITTLSRWENNGFTSTKLVYLIALIKYLEKRGVFFDDNKEAISTYKSASKNAWVYRSKWSNSSQ